MRPIKTLVATVTLILSMMFTLEVKADRILTSKDGKSQNFRLVEKQGENIVAVRTEDSKRFVIPISSLSENDQKFLATWTPPQDKGLMANRSTSTLNKGRAVGVQREAYTSQFQPRYSSGGYRYTTQSGGSSGGGCRFIGQKTVVVNPCR
jgi:hypothetical protein